MRSGSILGEALISYILIATVGLLNEAAYALHVFNLSSCDINYLEEDQLISQMMVLLDYEIIAQIRLANFNVVFFSWRDSLTIGTM